MATTRTKGKGYEIRVSLGYNINGKKLSKSIMWTPEPGMTARQIEKELNRQATLFEEKAKSGLTMSGTMRFADFAHEWMSEYSVKNHSPTTHKRYGALLARINQGIGHIRLDKLRPNHLMAFYNNLAEPGVAQRTKHDSAGQKIDKPALSPKTILHHHRLISAILNTAVHWQVIPDNIAARVAPPKVIKNEARYMDEDVVERVFQLLDGESIKHKAMIYLLLYSGMRRGELCGLEWQDIDFTKATVRIERTSQYIAGQGIITKQPKTNSSIRTVSVPLLVIQILKEYRAWQSEERLKLGDQWNSTERLFTQWNGLPIHPDSISQWFDTFLKRHELPHVTLHQLRHTNASHLIAQGVDPRTVAQRLGHNQVSTTMNLYTHQIQSAEQAAAQTLERAWAKQKS